MSVIGKGVFLHAPYMRTFKDVAVAVLCSQIHYWYAPSKNGKTKLRVKREGTFWIAKSRQEWSDETGLTDAQVKRALNVLADRGVIEKMLWKFSGAPTIHVRALTPQWGMLKAGEYLVSFSEASAMSEPDPHTLAPDAGSEALHNLALVTDDQSITKITQEKTQKNTSDIKASNDAGLLLSKKQNKPEGQKKIQQVDPVDVGVVISTAEIWQQLAEKYAHEYGESVALNKKEVAQLNLLTGQLKDRTEQVLGKVFERWVKFGKYAKAKYSAFPIPEVPTTGFVLKYPNAALNFWLSETDKTDVPAVEPVSSGLQSSEHQPVKLSLMEEDKDVDDKPITLVELLAMKKFIK